MENVRRFSQKIIQRIRVIFYSSNLSFIRHRDNTSYYQPLQSRRYQSGENNSVFKRELEGATPIVDSTVLLPNKSIHRRSSKNVGVGETSKVTRQTTREITEEEGQVTTVPTQTLPAGTHVYFSFNLRRRDFISFYVEAEFPVDTYLVDDPGFSNYKQAMEFSFYGGFRNQKEHRQRFRVPFAGNWYLIIDNPKPQDVAIHYEVRG